VSVSNTAAASFRIFAGGLALLGCVHGVGAAVPTNVERCLAIAAELNLGAPLPRLREKLRANDAVTIVALGSSSTTGFGTFGPGFPAVMKAELSRLHPSAHITMITSARVAETVGGNLARLDKDVLRFQPDLVVWQLGTNEVLWRGMGGGAASSIRDGIRRMKEANAEVVLMDLQSAPVVRAKPSHRAMEKLIAEVAREQGVGLFPRYQLMQLARAKGVRGLVAWDGLHNSAAGYRCIGLALARMIDEGVAR
jgi:acyl-CoA thioesterase I